MNSCAILVQDVSLRFNLKLSRSKRKIKNLFQFIFSRILDISESHLFEAIKNISFSVKRGSVIGVVGRNGSGKTTLARLLAGIYTPSKGKILINGKVNALFSLGGGFQHNIEFSGRENINNYCIYHGYKKSEIEKIIDDIISFSELGDFIDASMKTYSAGMKGRLVFSMAVYLKPDIVILDEVLSAGDIAFQQKAGNILEIFKDRNATIIFISHSIEMVKKHCDSVIWLDQGSIKMYDSTDKTLSAYKEYIEKVKGTVRKLDNAG